MDKVVEVIVLLGGIVSAYAEHCEDMEAEDKQRMTAIEQQEKEADELDRWEQDVARLAEIGEGHDSDEETEYAYGMMCTNVYCHTRIRSDQPPAICHVEIREAEFGHPAVEYPMKFCSNECRDSYVSGRGRYSSSKIRK